MLHAFILIMVALVCIAILAALLVGAGIGLMMLLWKPLAFIVIVWVIVKYIKSKKA